MKYVKDENNYHVSSELMRHISSRPIQFKDMEDRTAVAVFVKLVHDLNVAYALGDYEHTSDWDPYLEIKFTDGSTITTTEHCIFFDISEAEKRGYPDTKAELEIWLEDLLDDDEGDGTLHTHKFTLDRVDTIEVFTN